MGDSRNQFDSIPSTFEYGIDGIEYRFRVHELCACTQTRGTEIQM